MCWSGMEILNVFENSNEMCEGDEREWVPSGYVSYMTWSGFEELTQLLTDFRSPEDRVEFNFAYSEWALVDDIDGII
jgi:hypothetical protein